MGAPAGDEIGVPVAIEIGDRSEGFAHRIRGRGAKGPIAISQQDNDSGAAHDQVELAIGVGIYQVDTLAIVAGGRVIGA